MPRAHRRSQERPVSRLFDFLIFLLIIGSLCAFLFMLPGCEERDGRPVVVRPIDCYGPVISPDGCL